MKRRTWFGAVTALFATAATAKATKSTMPVVDLDYQAIGCDGGANVEIRTQNTKELFQHPHAQIIEDSDWSTKFEVVAWWPKENRFSVRGTNFVEYYCYGPVKLTGSFRKKGNEVFFHSGPYTSINVSFTPDTIFEEYQPKGWQDDGIRCFFPYRHPSV